MKIFKYVSYVFFVVGLLSDNISASKLSNGDFSEIEIQLHELREKPIKTKKKISDITFHFDENKKDNELSTFDIFNVFKNSLNDLNIKYEIGKVGKKNHINIHDGNLNIHSKEIKRVLLGLLQKGKLDALFGELDDPKIIKKSKKMIITSICELFKDLETSDTSLTKVFNTIPEGLYKFIFRVFYQHMRQEEDKTIDAVKFDKNLVQTVSRLIDLNVFNGDEPGSNGSFFKNLNDQGNSQENDKNAAYLFEMLSVFGAFKSERVKTLDLSGCNLNRMPRVIFSPHDCLKINLSGNHIDDISPEEIRDIKKLGPTLEIDLEDNRFSLKEKVKLEKKLPNVCFQNPSATSQIRNKKICTCVVLTGISSGVLGCVCLLCCCVGIVVVVVVGVCSAADCHSNI